MAPQKKLGPCKQEACDIQACISANNYQVCSTRECACRGLLEALACNAPSCPAPLLQESRCVKQIAALIACCDAAVAELGEGNKPVHCSFSGHYRRLIASAAAADGSNSGS
jgi:hypothetical protein